MYESRNIIIWHLVQDFTHSHPLQGQFMIYQHILLFLNLYRSCIFNPTIPPMLMTISLISNYFSRMRTSRCSNKYFKMLVRGQNLAKFISQLYSLIWINRHQDMDKVYQDHKLTLKAVVEGISHGKENMFRCDIYILGYNTKWCINAEYKNTLEVRQWGIYALYEIVRRSLSSSELQTWWIIHKCKTKNDLLPLGSTLMRF